MHFVGLVGSGQVGVKVAGIEEEIVANEVDKREVGVVQQAERALGQIGLEKMI